MLYFWITNAVKKSRSPPGSVSGPGFFFKGSGISGSEKLKSLSLMSLNSAAKHSTSMSTNASSTSALASAGHDVHHHHVPKHLRKKIRSSSISSVI